jgi:diguanylate cyclase
VLIKSKGVILTIFMIDNNYLIFDFVLIILVLLLCNIILYWNYCTKEKRERAIQLERDNIELKKNKDKLQLILDSTAEAICEIDNKGNFTFCNINCLKTLGYRSKNELLGKNMHMKIHHSYKDGSAMSIYKCEIRRFLKNGEGTNMNEGVFWRANGSSFDVKYSIYPQYKKEKIVGAVVTFEDNTEGKKTEEAIKYLTYHDSLTGLYNKMFFEEELMRLNIERNLPISVIVGDVNGLKLTNDIFGHGAGDKLLKEVASILRNACRADEIIARQGGDEFAILLPNTTQAQSQIIIERIKKQFLEKQVEAIRYSISLGSGTKVSVDQDFQSIIDEADDKMYLEKSIDRKSNNLYQIDTIIEKFHKDRPREKEHAKNVSEISQRIGKALDLSDREIKKLKDAGFLHDIGKMVLDQSIMKDGYDFTEQEKKQHAVIGYRILNSFDITTDLAETVLTHHERWDGSGYPKGLKGKEIPKTARIIAVAEYYDTMLQNKDISNDEIIKEMKKQSGVKFDPEIINTFVNISRKKV